jgi:hypothetical protein
MYWYSSSSLPSLIFASSLCPSSLILVSSSNSLHISRTWVQPCRLLEGHFKQCFLTNYFYRLKLTQQTPYSLSSFFQLHPLWIITSRAWYYACVLDAGSMSSYFDWTSWQDVPLLDKTNFGHHLNTYKSSSTNTSGRRAQDQFRRTGAN